MSLIPRIVPLKVNSKETSDLFFLFFGVGVGFVVVVGKKFIFLLNKDQFEQPKTKQKIIINK